MISQHFVSATPNHCMSSMLIALMDPVVANGCLAQHPLPVYWQVMHAQIIHAGQHLLSSMHASLMVIPSQCRPVTDLCWFMSWLPTGCVEQADAASITVSDDAVLRQTSPPHLASPQGIQAARDPAVFR